MDIQIRNSNNKFFFLSSETKKFFTESEKSPTQSSVSTKAKSNTKAGNVHGLLLTLNKPVQSREKGGLYSIQSLPAGCGTILYSIQSLPAGCGTILYSIQSLPAGCGTILYSIQSLPAGCGTILYSIQTLPAGCGDILYSIQTLPAGCGTTLYSVFYRFFLEKARKSEVFLTASIRGFVIFCVWNFSESCASAHALILSVTLSQIPSSIIDKSF
jgi:hypothetical protein